MKATALLEKQHREVEELFTTLEAGPGNEALVEKLATALTAHAMIEEELFYPAAKRFRKDLILESLEEHELMAHSVKRVFNCDPERETFHARIKACKEVVERHVEEEETELIPQMAEALGDEDDTLGAQMERRFQEIQKLGYEGAIAERRAKRSHEGERAAHAEGSRSTEKRSERSTSQKAGNHERSSAKKKVSHAHPRGA